MSLTKEDRQLLRISILVSQCKAVPQSAKEEINEVITRYYKGGLENRIRNATHKLEEYCSRYPEFIIKLPRHASTRLKNCLKYANLEGLTSANLLSDAKTIEGMGKNMLLELYVTAVASLEKHHKLNQGE